MRTRILKFIAALVLALGAVVTTGSPAQAHNHSGYSVLFCTVEMQESNSSMYLAHSWPIYMDSQIVIYWCAGWLGVVRYTWRVWVSVADGSHVSSNWCHDRGAYECPDLHPNSPP